MKKTIIIVLIGLFVILGVLVAFLLGKIKWGDNKPPINSGLNEDKPGALKR